MPVEWSGLGPELPLTVHRGAAEPLRAQLERQLRDAIRDGRLAVGERLPSSRELARELGLNLGERAIQSGIAAVADLLQGRS